MEICVLDLCLGYKNQIVMIFLYIVCCCFDKIRECYICVMLYGTWEIIGKQLSFGEFLVVDCAIG